ncbi:MAG: type II toxin-antitoxin system VapC family toxin [Desulfobacterales bacterium]|nr:type II toxin-antitoxin system VapC family toxin [Desulfobacterales bacterium]
MTKRILFDSHAILKWTQREQGYKKVKSLMLACREGTVAGYMNYLNLGEVYYKSIRVAGAEKSKAFLENFLRLPVQLVLPEADLIWKAAEIKAAHPISYADCIAAATALKHDAAILTGDPEFKKLGPLVSVQWL